jgi:hypothetical protein
VISALGVRVHQEKIQAILEWLTEISTNWNSHFLVEYSKNRFACDLMDGHIQDDMYIVVDDIIYYRDRIYLVHESTFPS